MVNISQLLLKEGKMGVIEYLLVNKNNDTEETYNNFAEVNHRANEICRLIKEEIELMSIEDFSVKQK